MNLQKLLSEIRENNVKITITEGNLNVLFLDKNVNSVNKELLQTIKENKKELIEYLQSLQNIDKQEFTIEKAEVLDSYPLSFSQKRLWVLSQYETEALTYNMPTSITLEGEYNIENLKKSIITVIDRHEILRTVFRKNSKGEINQWILDSDDVDLDLDYHDFRLENDALELVNKYIQEDSFVAFDLENGPLLRVALFQLKDEEYVFYYNMHHIISDGWSKEVLANDVLNFYNAFETKRKPTIDKLEIHYKDYAVWQLNQVESGAYDKGKEYWLNKLKGDLLPIDLPSSKKRPSIKTNNGKVLRTFLDKETTNTIKSFSKKENGSLFITIVSIWNALIYRYTGNRDIVFGVPVAERPQKELENQIGFYTNTLALRNQIDPKETFLDFYYRIKKDVLKSYEYQNYPFDRLVEDLNIKRDISRNPVFDIMISQQNLSQKKRETIIDEKLVQSIEDLGNMMSKFDLNISFEEIGDTISFSIIYNTDVYEEDMVRRLMLHYKSITQTLLTEPSDEIGKIDFLLEDEKNSILKDTNQKLLSYPKDKSIIDLFEDQVKSKPNNVAIVHEDLSVTYKDLGNRVDRVASYLRNKGVGKNVLVGVCIENPLDMITGILAIIKSGGAYVPIDFELPENRIRYIIEDSGIATILGDQNTVTSLSTIIKEEKVTLEIFEDVTNYQPISPLEYKVDLDDMCYVIYTSGSTGKPKGVAIQHESILDYFYGIKDAVKLDAPYQYGLMSTMSADLGNTVLYAALLTGGTLHTFNLNALRNPLSLINYFSNNQIDYIKIVPFYWLSIEGSGSLLLPNKGIIFGGSALEPAIISKIKKESPNIEIFNHYGPTETTIGKLIYKVDVNNEYHNVPIGKPFSKSMVYVLDENEQLSPIGVIGELHIGGKGIAKEYLNLPELTDEKFIVKKEINEGRIYKTGDLVRRLEDGNHEFIGRKDNQIKIRGYRVELGEIENALSNLPYIKSSVVTVKKDENSNHEIVAYLISEKDLVVKDLRSDLSEFLPSYMLPGHFVQLEQFPLTLNGKIDYKKLPEVSNNTISSGELFLEARTSNEKLLINICKQVLNRKTISLHDNFYNLGGDSIKSIQIVSRLRENGYELKLEDILRTPIFVDLAKKISKKLRDIDQSPVIGEVDLTPIQRMFFFDSSITDHSYYNQSVLLKSINRLDSDLVNKSVNILVKHHDSLRMIYKRESDQIIQYNKDIKEQDYNFGYYNLKDEKDELDELGKICQNTQLSFELEEGPLFSVLHCSLSDGDRIGLFCHHLVIDGVSWRIILEDFSTIYKALENQEKVKLPLKTDSFQRWSGLLKEYSSNLINSEIHKYWKSVCSQANHNQLNTLSDNKVGKLDSIVSFGLNKNVTEALQENVHSAYSTDINDILITALGMALYNTFEVSGSVIKMEGHGREEIIDNVDVSRTVGWFTSVFPFVLKIEPSSRIKSLVGVKESFRRIPNKGIDYGILKYLTNELDHKLEPTIVFNYLGDFGSNVSDNEGEVLYEYSSEYKGDNYKEKMSSEPLSINGMIVNEELFLQIEYSSDVFSEGMMNKFNRSYEDELKSLIKELSNQNTKILTPSDLTYKKLEVEELDAIKSNGEVEDVYKLSPLQEGFYYHSLTEGSLTNYLGQRSFTIKIENITKEAIENSYKRIVDKYAILRTSFTRKYQEEILQIVWKSVDIDFVYKKINNVHSEEEKREEVQNIKSIDFDRGFDLSNPSQMRLTVVELSNDYYEFIWTYHHIIMDAWSVGVLVKDFVNLIKENDVSDQILPKPNNYSNYIQWLHNLDKTSTKSFWKNYLNDYANNAKVPFKRKLKNKNNQNTVVNEITLGTNLFSEITDLCEKLDITKNTFILGVWGYLLAQYNNTNDVVFGQIVSGRPPELEGVEEIVGLFINTIPVRVSFNEKTTINDLLQEIHEYSINSIPHHYESLSNIQDFNDLGSELVNHVISFQNMANQNLANENSKNWELNGSESDEQSTYDFGLRIVPLGNDLKIEFLYDENSFEISSINKIGEHLYNLIKEFIKNENEELKKCEFLSKIEKDDVLFDQNQKTTTSETQTIIDLFENQVAQTPNKIAIDFDTKKYTYKELDLESNKLAHILRSKYSFKNDAHIGLLLENSDLTIISILGILKAGYSYIPIDINYPRERQSYIVDDAQLGLLITTTDYMFEVDFYEGDIFAIDVELNEADEIAILPNRDHLTNDSLAYVLYTSGSTGHPKGVKVRHSSLFNYLSWGQDYYLKSKSLRNYNFGWFTSLSFDLTITSLFLPIISGGTLFIPKGNDLLTNLKWYLKQDISNIKLTPAHVSLCEELNINESNLELAIVGGDKLLQKHVSSLQSIKETIHIFNEYGPTETTVGCTVKEIHSENEINIGVPIANTRVYIMNEQMNIQPVGIVGEICIAGYGLAEGYLNKDELTNQKFVSDPYYKGEYLYRTGDLGIRLPNGEFEYIGRKDNQVKIRGYRIELEEIEKAIGAIPDVKSNTVVIVDDEIGNKELVAFVHSNVELNINGIKEKLNSYLPDYMIPSNFFQLDSIPLTVNGKVDKKKILSSKILNEVNATNAYIAPSNELEKTLVDIWEIVLEREKIGVEDNFFAIGGNSLRGMKVLIKIENEFAIQMNVTQLFENPTISKLASLIESILLIQNVSEEVYDTGDELLI
ncbi:non-ribosomal peptide synthetase [Aquimarina litoralis]|uniref:non-ribosomal peptide synthetase n=1 Tax=Aquimarina litoralis TaxID=584605 RepID=UPI001C55E994|nr:non-ribosomal peptide synthetase [Aquimarina litoralis]MBW1295667.1 amino acid adenylation domain-containing protein [Aquimarina litoralis]